MASSEVNEASTIKAPTVRSAARRAATAPPMLRPKTTTLSGLPRRRDRYSCPATASRWRPSSDGDPPLPPYPRYSRRRTERPPERRPIARAVRWEMSPAFPCRKRTAGALVETESKPPSTSAAADPGSWYHHAWMATPSDASTVMSSPATPPSSGGEPGSPRDG